jgi:cytochrome c553
MTPPPPELTGERLTRWTPAQLFSIVKHGIKFTGMPAWPTLSRDDEVWAMVAFLTRLPATDRDEYRQLAGGTASDDNAAVPVGTIGAEPAPDLALAVCARCHGRGGTGRDGLFPSLAGQRADYLHAALRAFKDRSRHSATMSEIAARLNDADMRTLATYYERLPGRVPASAGDLVAVSRGSAIATRGSVERDIPACNECHGPAASPKNPAYPRLAGQYSSYLVQQLELLKQRRRGGSPRVNLMHAVVDRLGPQDIRDAALYYASLPPANPIE